MIVAVNVRTQRRAGEIDSDLRGRVEEEEEEAYLPQTPSIGIVSLR